MNKEYYMDFMSNHSEEVSTEFTEWLNSFHKDIEIPVGHTVEDVEKALDLWHSWSMQYVENERNERSVFFEDRI